jgi:C4-dicarboxylate-specific signal transduction histidine kinase
MTAKLLHWIKQAADRTSRLHRLNIGPRLALCFMLIIFAMSAGSAVLIWQFQQARIQADRLASVDQELIAVLQAHISFMSFYQGLDVLAQTENTTILIQQIETIHNAYLQATETARNALSRLATEVDVDPTLLPTLSAIQSELPAQLRSMQMLAKSGDWRAVRLRLVNQIGPLESRSATLVKNVDRQVSEQRAQAVLNIKQAQQRIYLIVPITVAITLPFAAILGFTITRSITRPLGQLVKGSTALASGDFSHRVLVVGNDEIAQLGNVFNDMIATLQSDIEERKQAEEALNRARSDLAHVARLATLNALTASIAHEVNQPLSGIVTNASTCLRMLDSNPPNVDGARETARRTIRDGNRASEVITRLRALFSRKEFTLEPLNLNEATREVIALSLSDLQRNRVTLRFEFADDLPAVSGDRVQLQQVILNLLRNASDAMITVEGRPRDLLVRTERDAADRVRLSVKDAGVGFDPEAGDKLFAAFHTTKKDGMGIGLSVSRSIIEAHQGRLWAVPNDGPGATFFFSIPCQTDT